MIMKTLLRIFQTACLLGIAAALGGCVTYYGPGSSEFDALSNHNVYALVRYVHPGPDDKFVDEYCALPAEGKDPGCRQRNEIDHVSVAIGRNSWGIKLGGLLVPKSVHVQAGDVIVYRTGTDAHPYNKFVRLAAREADSERLHCGWVGSKILTSGGVVCEGWRYDRDFPLLAN